MDVGCPHVGMESKHDVAVPQAGAWMHASHASGQCFPCPNSKMLYWIGTNKRTSAGIIVLYATY